MRSAESNTDRRSETHSAPGAILWRRAWSGPIPIGRSTITARKNPIALPAPPPCRNCSKRSRRMSARAGLTSSPEFHDDMRLEAQGNVGRDEHEPACGQVSADELHQPVARAGIETHRRLIKK